VLFTPSCKRSLWEIQRYCWDEKSNKPIDEDDHAMECLYRMEIAGPRWMNVGEENSSPIVEEEVVSDQLELEPMDYTGL
jgi:hypothetical protein